MICSLDPHKDLLEQGVCPTDEEMGTCRGPASLGGVGTGLCFLAVTSTPAGEALGTRPPGRAAWACGGPAAAVHSAVTLDRPRSSQSICTCRCAGEDIVSERTDALRRWQAWVLWAGPRPSGPQGQRQRGVHFLLTPGFQPPRPSDPSVKESSLTLLAEHRGAVGWNE